MCGCTNTDGVLAEYYVNVLYFLVGAQVFFDNNTVNKLFVLRIVL